jgi:hypothetical protein
MHQDRSDEKEAIALILDVSSSAKDDWDEVRETARRIQLLMGLEPETSKLFIFGSPIPISIGTLEQDTPPSASEFKRPCSLIAPILKPLLLERMKYSVVIIGNGEVFDLDDWADDPRFGGWLLVRTGGESLKKTSSTITEISWDQLDGDEDTLRDRFSRGSREPDERTSYVKQAPFKWQIDASGYPLVLVEPLQTYVHLFPVTKPQFEKFLASGKQPNSDDDWYARLLAMNPRASYRSEDPIELEQLFITGITTDEALAFGRWLGRRYKLLTAVEWRECREWFAQQVAPSSTLELADQMSEDALAVWRLIEDEWFEQSHEINLQELSLMRHGILEWVVDLPGAYYGVGDPRSAKSLRTVYDPVRPLGQGSVRHKNLGLRFATR